MFTAMLLMRFAWLAGLVGSAIAATPDQWRSQSIYFLLTDRFAQTDGSTSASCDASMRVWIQISNIHLVQKSIANTLP
jgi:hypothetical protein